MKKKTALEFAKTLRDHSMIAFPAFRGAPYPPFDPLKINETEFPDNLRCKGCTTWLGTAEGKDPTVILDYTSQAWDNPEKLFAEIQRWAHAWEQKEHLEPGQKVDVEIRLQDRDHYHKDKFEFSVGTVPERNEVPPVVEPEHDDFER